MAYLLHRCQLLLNKPIVIKILSAYHRNELAVLYTASFLFWQTLPAPAQA